MDPRIETLQRDWRSRSCSPGYAGLHALADEQFSGSIATADTRGFMVNGRLVGIHGGTIESFWSSEVTALEAEDPALPLLCAMLIGDASVEGEYYTGETRISEVNETLSSGGFTGYLELSENVFSGDYFQLYYGGTSRSVAILGTEDRVITGSEAFERANDEVGIYEVISVDIDVIDIPEPEVDETAAPVASVGDSDGGAKEVDEPAPETVEPADEDPDPAVSRTEEELETPEVDERPEREEDETPSITPSDSADIATLAEAAKSGSGVESTPIDDEEVSPAPTEDAHEWLTIPTLDPNHTTLIEPPDDSSEPDETEPVQSETSPAAEPEPEPAEPESTTSSDERLEEVSIALDAAERENEQLRERLDELESRLEQTPVPDIDGETQDLTPQAALEGTNVFVRYESKAEHTLADASERKGDADEVMDNIRLEWHTAFEDAHTTVEGRAYEEFLQSSIEFQFASWVIEELLFELRETGGDKDFEDLYIAIPEVDRVEFHGTIPVHTRDSNERSSDTYSFDLVFRNSMGDPLLVAAVHDDRDPADAEGVGRLLADANSVASERNTLRAAMFLTRSYFEPEAIGTVAEATEGSLLRGGSKESYVRVSRKQGFHLCLIESRNETFHLNVPDR